MKAKAINFYSTADNIAQEKAAKKKATKKVVEKKPVTGHVSGAGKVVIPFKSASALSFSPDGKQYQVGTQSGQRRSKVLFLVPAADGAQDTFTITSAAKSYTLSLPVILKKLGVDYTNKKYKFNIKPFDHGNGMAGFELRLHEVTEKEQTDAPRRGRKRKNPAE